MPTIYDNVENKLLEGLKIAFKKARKASFCVGYFHLRGWKEISAVIRSLEERDFCLRILVGMHQPPEEILLQLQGIIHNSSIDRIRLTKLKERVVRSFKQQLEVGLPSKEAEDTLKDLCKNLKSGRVKIKSYLRNALHGKLYLFEREDELAPLIGFVGSSNFTFPGLLKQGELNIDVLDQDAVKKLSDWFERNWNDEFSFDITKDLINLLENSWACQTDVSPYHIYLKIAYFLSQEARQGEIEFKIPRIFAEKGTPLLDFQCRAVSLTAHYVLRRGGALLGDVVGLGKTLMAIAVARIFQEDHNINTLVICPPKLKPMWQEHIERYEIIGRVVSLGEVIDKLPNLPRYRLLIIDESHNLRNRGGKRYKAIQNYIELNEPFVLLLTATPYNKHFEDLSNQLRLFIDEDKDLHIRPEKLFQSINEDTFRSKYQILPTSLRAFEKSPFPEDWRDLMRLFLVRRTRSFIMKHYANFDSERSRYYVIRNNERYYFPIRQPKRLSFSPDEQYKNLFSEKTVKIIGDLHLPRYGLANYLIKNATNMANEEEKLVIDNLNRAGRRLIGFCRTNLFKRLESSGYSFILSVKRHIIRNFVILHALERNLEIPIGSQDPSLMDETIADEDIEFDDENLEQPHLSSSRKLDALRNLAEITYSNYADRYRSRFRWIKGELFNKESLEKKLKDDTYKLLDILNNVEEWKAENDNKLNELYNLVTEKHPEDKIIIFTQFADTARYLKQELLNRGISNLELIVSDTDNQSEIIRRFSPNSNGGLRDNETEIRILITTDVLSEGQNLQDCHICVNYDLPWAVIRIIQRAGRVDRIGQKNHTIIVYSFLPEEGIEKIIALRKRLVERLKENQEIIGTDESFFGEEIDSTLRDLYTEKSGVLDNDEKDEDIDLASSALQIWNSASEKDRKIAQSLPPIVSSTALIPSINPAGLVTYIHFPDGTNTLIRVNEKGELVSQSPSAIFHACKCSPDTPKALNPDNHYELIKTSVEFALKEQQIAAGQLGSLRSISRKIYERLRSYRERLGKQNPNENEEIEQVIDMIYRYPLKESARDTFRRQFRLGISDKDLAKMVIQKAKEGELCVITDQETEPKEPQIVCALGLKSNKQEKEIYA